MRAHYYIFSELCPCPYFIIYSKVSNKNTKETNEYLV